MTNCECEEFQQSANHSLGSVANHEAILLVGVDPRNCRDGELKASAIDERKLKKAAQSVIRRDFSSEEEVNREVVTKATACGRNFVQFGFVTVAFNIRQLTDESGVGLFCVIDDGIANDAQTFPSHAVLAFADVVRRDAQFWSSRSGEGVSAKQAALANLVETFQQGRQPLTDVF